MAECVECGIDLTYVNSMPNQRCNKCHGNWLKSSIQKDTSENTKERPLAAASVTHQAPVTDPMLYLKEQQRLEEKNRLSKQELASVLLTTANTLQDIKVTKYLGVVSAECAYGMNVFKDMFANVRNLVGGRSAAVEDTMRDSRETVMQELKREAHAKGANAVIAVDLDYTQLGAGGNMMVLVSASGTAVVIEE